MQLFPTYFTGQLSVSCTSPPATGGATTENKPFTPEVEPLLFCSPRPALKTQGRNFDRCSSAS